MKYEATMIPDYGNILKVGEISMDGDKFIVGLPSFDTIAHMLDTTASHGNYSKWSEYWQQFGLSSKIIIPSTRLWSQRFAVNGQNLLHCSNSDYRSDELDYDVRFVEQHRILLTLIPMSGDKYDENAYSDFQDWQPVYGGTLYVDNKPVKWNEMPRCFSTIRIGDTVPGYELPWFKFWNLLYGAFVVQSSYILDEFIYRFQLGRY